MEESGSMMKNGIIYIADGLGFAGQCVQSIKTMRTRCKVRPPIHVFTTNPEVFEDMKAWNVTTERIEPKPGLACKPASMGKTPFKRSLFLDTDTMVLNDLAWEPFRILDRFDFALCHAPTRGFQVMRKVPNCVPSWNSGVVFFNDSEQAKKVLRQYKRFKPTGPRTSDQAHLSNVLWKTKTNVFTLPPEYNCRGRESGVPTPAMLRIIHHHRAFKLLKRGLTVDEIIRRFATNQQGQ